MASFRNTFQDHRRVTEQLLRHRQLSESRNKLSEEGYWKAVLRIRDVYPGSRMFIPDPGSWFLPITDPGSRVQKQHQKRGVKNFLCHTFLCSHKSHKIKNYFSFEVLKRKIWANFLRIIELFTQKIVTKLSKIMVWDPGSGIRKKPIPDPGVKRAPDPGSGSATLLERISQLVSDFIEASRPFVLNFLHKKTTKNYENNQRSFKKYWSDF
jgi:hypothetical protein